MTLHDDWFARTALVAAAAIALTGLPLSAQTGSAPDSLFRRAQRMVNEGDTVAGRALVDSLVRASREGTGARAEALFWRGMLAADTGVAHRDYITIIVEYPTSPRAADALLRLGQAEHARGDRVAALAHFDRLLLDYPTSPVAGDAWYWVGRVRMSAGDATGGCAALDSARRRVRAADVERRNQVAFAAQPCAALAAAPAAAPPTTQVPVVVPPPVPPASASTSARPPASDTASKSSRWSAQIAAYKTKAEADRLVRNLKTRGVDARVDKLTLFHVRSGMFRTRADAARLVAELKRKRITAFVVEAPRREP